MSNLTLSDTSDMSSSSSLDDVVAVGLSDPEHSHRSRRMLDLVNRLHNTGVQVDIDLPQIAVIGAQSAGKSSLIESISGVSLPRASGTCTRCPTECRLSFSDDPWKCVISLHWIVDSTGQPIGKSEIVPFGGVISKKSEVEDRLRRAQMAILNPSTPAAKFLEEDNMSFSSELSFSRNCVSLQISGPDVADLSFCDLPGLIASSGSGSKSDDIALIKSLAESYIVKESCVILLTVACETDFMNQGAHELARAMDPEGKRTVGVLTKPDRIPRGDEDTWISLIKNNTHPLVNNWFCVKQPSFQELKDGTTWQQARDSENLYFSSTSPWSVLDPIYTKYLRTSNLVDRLSRILSDLIAKRLPEIQLELESSIQEVLENLNKLPKPPSANPLDDVVNLVHAFTTDLETNVEGLPEKNGLLQHIRPAQGAFREEIHRTAPNFQPYEKKERTCIALEYESATPDSAETTSSAPIYLDEVCRIVHEARTRELPGHYPYVVQERFVSDITAKWLSPAQSLGLSIHAMVAEQVKNLVSKHFGAFGQGMLEHRVKVIMQEHLKKRLADTQGKIAWLHMLEDRPFSLNEHYVADYKEKHLTLFRGYRKRESQQEAVNAIAKGQSDGRVSNALAHLAQLGLTVKEEDLLKLLPIDEMDPILEIMAEVRAYFQVAFKRFVDIIPLAIDREMVRGTTKDVLRILSAGLQIHGPDGHKICHEYARESPQDAGRREELMKKLERLNTASEELLQV